MIKQVMMMARVLRRQAMVVGQKSKRHCNCQGLRKKVLEGPLQAMAEFSDI
jgi:hypothetical protein